MGFRTTSAFPIQLPFSAGLSTLLIRVRLSTSTVGQAEVVRHGKTPGGACGAWRLRVRARTWRGSDRNILLFDSDSPATNRRLGGRRRAQPSRQPYAFCCQNRKVPVWRANRRAATPRAPVTVDIKQKVAAMGGAGAGRSRECTQDQRRRPGTSGRVHVASPYVAKQPAVAIGLQ